jgi:hypothetical protein
MAPKLLTFPNPVNDVAARTVAAGVFIMALVAATTGALWLTIPLAYGFVARVASGPRFSPLGRLATEVVAPRLPARARLVPGPPKRFAQAIGALFTLAALLCWLTGHPFATTVVLSVLLVPAFCESVLGYCVGCQMFALLMRIGIVPESVCVECADISGPAAARRRAHVLGN